MVYVGLGGHASYPQPGATWWPAYAYEYHRGNGEKFIPDSDNVHYLPRVGNDNAPDWLRYSGRWGDEDLKNDGVGNTDGDTAPRGPAFLDLERAKLFNNNRFRKTAKMLSLLAHLL